MNKPDPSAPAGTAGFLAAGGAGKRAGLAAGPRAVYQAVLRAFATQGRPPEPAELESAARRHGITAGQALATLAAADVLGLDDEGRIRMAYPFSAAPTPHLVTIAGWPLVYSMGAIDALGIPAMLATGAVITSSDPLTGRPGTATSSSPPPAWVPPAPCASPAAAYL